MASNIQNVSDSVWTFLTEFEGTLFEKAVSILYYLFYTNVPSQNLLQKRWQVINIRHMNKHTSHTLVCYNLLRPIWSFHYQKSLDKKMSQIWWKMTTNIHRNCHLIMYSSNFQYQIYKIFFLLIIIDQRMWQSIFFSAQSITMSTSTC